MFRIPIAFKRIKRKNNFDISIKVDQILKHIYIDQAASSRLARVVYNIVQHCLPEQC
jgi:hypothetical protein